MSDFYDRFNACMTASGFPTPEKVFESVGEVLEFLHKCHSAGLEVETVGAAIERLVAIGVIPPETGEYLALTLGSIATVTVAAYKAQCLTCLGSATGSELRDYLASNAPEPWLRDSFADAGVDLSDIAVA